MRIESNDDLTDKPNAVGLGGFGEAGTIEPGIEDDSERDAQSEVPTAPDSPSDEPASNGPLNPA